jgi:hypothetical protein
MKVKLFKTLNIVMETIVHIPSFVDDTTSLFHALRTQLRWERHNFFKRMICHYMGESHELNILVQTIERTFNRQVEGVFLNYYEDGNDYAPYHADKYNCDTCLVSLGTMRTLRFKHNTTKENTDFELKDGDLLFVPNEINHAFKHSLLKRTKVVESRVSILVFLKN